MTTEELLERYAVGERDFSKVKLSGIGELLEGVCLKDINLSDSRIDNLSFVETNLSRANLKNTILWQTNFIGADLSETCFERANLTQAILKNAKGNNTNFIRTIFLDTIMPDGSIRNEAIF